jgi:peptidoglycan hydrolase-like protein with peptidoglycan-binding domain
VPALQRTRTTAAATRAHGRGPAANNRPGQAPGGVTGHLLGLQRTAGNAAVSRMVAGGGGGAETAMLRVGSRGAEVEKLQRALNGSGRCNPVAVDGQFGPGTGAAVRQAQAAFGLMADGIVGPATWGALSGAPAQSAGQPTGAAGQGGLAAQAAAKLAQIKTLIATAAAKPVPAAGAQVETSTSVGAAATADKASLRGPQDDDESWYDQAANAVSNAAEVVSETASSAASSVADTASQAAGAVSDAAGQVYDNVTEAASGAAAWVGDKAGEAYGAAAAVAGQAYSAASSAASSAGTWAQGVVEKAVDTATSAAATVGTAASSVVSDLEALGQAVVQGVAAELSDLRDLAGRIAAGLGLDKVLGALEALFQSLKGKLSRLLSGEGPLSPDEPKQVSIPLGVDQLTGGVTPCDSTEGTVDTKHPLSRQGDAKIEPASSFGANQPSFEIDGIAEVAEGRDKVDISIWLQLDNKWAIRSNGKTDITGPDDSKLTPANFKQAADDLDPAKQDAGLYPGSVPRNQFWSSSLTTEHELFHEAEILKSFPRIAKAPDTVALANNRYVDVSSMWSFFRAIGFDMGRCDDASRKVFEQIKKDIGAKVVREMNQAVSSEAAERRAYASGRQGYTDLAESIREHGKRKGWT